MSKRPCWVEIDTRALEDNYRFLRSLAGPDTECLAIVKADAYGHGIAHCAPALVRAGARWLGVTSAEEGMATRAVCPTASILIMGGVFPGQAAELITHHLTPVVWDLQQFDAIEAAAHAAALGPGTLPVHLEIDTGMSRQGVSLDDLPHLVSRFAAGSPLRMEAVMTHLYASDEAGNATTAAQIGRLEQALSSIAARSPGDVPPPEWLSVGASAALLGGEGAELAAVASRWNLRPMLRLGLALYGLAPHFDPAFTPGEEPSALTRALDRLRPVLTWKTRVATVRSISSGAEIGYNGTFIATEPMEIALLAIGYADGLDRQLGNQFSLLIRGERAPLVGRISMDQAVIDVTGLPAVVPGDEVIVIGNQGDHQISAFDHARAAGTIPWEIFTRIAARVERIEV